MPLGYIDDLLAKPITYQTLAIVCDTDGLDLVDHPAKDLEDPAGDLWLDGIGGFLVDPEQLLLMSVLGKAHKPGLGGGRAILADKDAIGIDPGLVQ
jgi:hypothetical protein